MAEILIVGTGAMAGLFGARLADHAEVTLLGTWKAGLAALRADGIKLQLNGQVMQRTVRVSSDPAECAGARQALVLVKSWQTARAARMLAECLSPDGVALTLQNGLGNIEQLREALGEERAALGVTTTGATLMGPGRMRVGGVGPTHVAPHPRLEALVDLMQVAGFEVESADNLEGLVWGKLAINAGINPLTALLEVPNGALARQPQARAVMIDAARETAAVAAARAIELPYADPAEAVRQVAERTASNLSSMLQDIQRGAPTEIDAINGAVAEAAEQVGVSTPVNRTLWGLVRAKVDQAEAIR